MNDDLRKQIEQCIIAEHGLAAPSLVDDLMRLFAEQLAARERETSIQIIDAEYDALYELLPTGDVNAWDLLKSIQAHMEHLGKVKKRLTAPQGEAKVNE